MTESRRTTLAVRGISKNYSQQMIFQILDVACGSQRSYNFVHLPKRGRQEHGGLAIVNFLDEASCDRCLHRLVQMSDAGKLPGIKSIGQSYIQGFAQNLAYFTVLASGRVEEKPIIFEGGQEVHDIWPVIQRHVTPELIDWAKTQAKALFGQTIHEDLETETSESSVARMAELELNGRLPTVRELAHIRRLLPGMRSYQSTDFLIFSL